MIPRWIEFVLMLLGGVLLARGFWWLFFAACAWCVTRAMMK